MCMQLLNMNKLFFLYLFIFSISAVSANLKTMKETPECLNSPKLEVLNIMNNWHKVNTGELTYWFLPKKTCIKLGNIQFKALQYLGPGLNAINSAVGKLEITSISEVTKKAIPENLYKRFDYKDLDSLQLFFSLQSTYFDQGVYLIKFKTVKQLKFNFDRDQPAELNFAKTIKAIEFEKLLKNKKTILVDIRTSDQFKKSFHPKAINLPYIKGNQNDFNYWARITDYEKEDQFDIKTLKITKKTNIIITSGGPFDVRGIRALTILKNAGFDNLFWFKGGELERNNRQIITPSQPKDIKIISSEEALQLSKEDGAQLFHIAFSKPEKSIQSKSTTFIPYSRKEDILWETSKLEFKTILSKGDLFNTDLLPKDKDAKIVFYGTDQFDWEPYKACLWAKEKGWKNIYWLRSGLSEWRSMALLLPEQYLIGSIKK